MAEFPILRYLKVNRETKPKRDILEPEEFTNLRKWMTNVWCREKDITEEERLKRKVYGLYLTIQYYGGFRNKEILGIRWKDISAIPTESKDDQRINRAIFIPASNSKTGRSRSCVAPVAIQFERIREHYKKAHIEINKDDFVFINLAKTKRGKNYWIVEVVDSNNETEKIRCWGINPEKDFIHVNHPYMARLDYSPDWGFSTRCVGKSFKMIGSLS